MDKKEAVEVYGRLKDQVVSMPQNAATRVVDGILNQHAPKVDEYSLVATCSSDECHEDQGYDGAIPVSWPCATAQTVIDGLAE